MLDEIETVQLKSIELSLKSNLLLSDLNLQLKANGIHCLLGPNGSGKTLTNKILSLLITPDQGEILWNDDILKLSKNTIPSLVKQIGYMPQKPIFLNKAVESNIEFPLTIQGIPKTERKKRVKSILMEFNIEEIKSKNAWNLSLGQQQKVSLARSMITNPRLLILDEPTASLDQASTHWFESFLKDKITDDPRIVVFTTHDQFQVKRVATNLSVIINGQIVESGTIDLIKDSKNEMARKFFQGKLII